MTFDEDAHQARTGNGPAVAAVLRKLVPVRHAAGAVARGPQLVVTRGPGIRGLS